MAHYRTSGSVPPKRHTQHRSPSGALYREELMGEEGFSSDSSLLYHVGVPSAVLEARAWELPDQSVVPNEPLLPRHLRLHDLFPGSGAGTDVVTGRRLVLANADVRISYVVAAGTSPRETARAAPGPKIRRSAEVRSCTGTIQDFRGESAKR